MFNELSDTLKAKLYDYAYTPFMSSFIISWIVINHKYLLIYFSNITDPEKKLELLSLYGNNHINKINIYDPILPIIEIFQIGSHYFWYPLSFALFYVFGYPYFSNGFYSWTRKMANEKKKIKLKRDNQEPINKEEQKELLFENHTLRRKIEDLKVEISTQETKYDERLKTETMYINQTLELEKQNSSTQNNANTELLNMHKKTIEERDSAQKNLDEHIQILHEQRSKMEQLQKDIQKYKNTLSINNLLMSGNEIAKKYNLSEFEVNLLKYLDNNNFNYISQNDFIGTYLMSEFKFTKRHAEDKLKGLFDHKIIKKNPSHYIILTQKSEDAIRELWGYID